jgi:hypothetical protein
LASAACLLAAVLAASVGLRAVGFTHDCHPWSSAFLYTAGAITHVVNPPEGLLTEAGQAIRIAVVSQRWWKSGRA